MTDPNGVLRRCYDDHGVPPEPGVRSNGEAGMELPGLTPEQEVEADLCRAALEQAMMGASIATGLDPVPGG